MTDFINAVQTLVLSVALVIAILVLGWTVYVFKKFALMFDALADEMRKPKSDEQSEKDEQIDHEQNPEPEPAVLVQRHTCHRCRAKLPELPTHSIVKESATVLVFKCRRCGKETEIDH